jgi:uncharacterized membrane protein YsdA (DUF1294 family)
MSRFLVIAVVLVAGGAGLAFHFGMHPLFGALAGVNVATMALYGYDKAISGGARRRVPENVLHLVALLGGSPAALLSQTLFRHKTVKPSFQRAYWLIVVLQLAILGTVAWFRFRPA